MGDGSAARQAAIALVTLLDEAYADGRPVDPRALATVLRDVGDDDANSFVLQLAGLAAFAVRGLAGAWTTTPGEVLREWAMVPPPS